MIDYTVRSRFNSIDRKSRRLYQTPQHWIKSLRDRIKSFIVIDVPNILFSFIINFIVIIKWKTLETISQLPYPFIYCVNLSIDT